jgi:lipase
VDGLEIAVWHWAGKLEPTLFFLHATGFHGRCWDEVIGSLGDHNCYAMETRGHGRSGKSEPPCNWRDAAKDAESVASQLGLRGAIGIGHSMGGHSLSLAASRNPEIFSGLVLIDPVIFREEKYRQPDEPMPDFKSHPVSRRRNQWQSWQDMHQRYRDRPPFSRWKTAVLEDYCQFALLPEPGGDGYVLACQPEFEASIYVMGNSHLSNIYEDLSKIEMPVLVVRAGKEMDNVQLDFDFSPTNPKLASLLKQGRDLHFQNRTHFVPMEGPEMTAAFIQDFIGSVHRSKAKNKGAKK